MEALAVEVNLSGNGWNFRRAFPCKMPVRDPITWDSPEWWETYYPGGVPEKSIRVMVFPMGTHEYEYMLPPRNEGSRKKVLDK